MVANLENRFQGFRRVMETVAPHTIIASGKGLSTFRADRFATLYLFHPLRSLRALEKRIPILMYHGISDVDDSRRHPYYRTVTSPRVFEQHLKFLQDQGYRTISLGDAVQRIHRPDSAAQKAVVITFDDGFQNFYSRAFPLLTRYGSSAAVFLPTAYINRDVQKFNGVECLTWSQVRELQKAGIHFGSHTATHPDLRNLGPKELEEEIRSSKQKIEEELGSPVTSFAYPYAFPETDGPFRRHLGRLLEENGYKNGVSTIIGIADRFDDRFFMKRLPMNSCDDLPLLRAKLEGGYDWLHAIQYASKLMTINR